MRILFFGNAEYGAGSRGPIPKKKLVKRAGQEIVVILTDEWGTSKYCCECGEQLQQIERTRVFSCPTHEHGHANAVCSVRYIDRDVNGAVNIAMCGVERLLNRGIERPVHLVRPVRTFRVDEEELAADE